MNSLNEYILQFVNSKDIREHLRNIGYTFNALEAAWLVWQSRYTTLEARHEGWKHIIAEYPDCPIEERLNTIPRPSLHRFLEEYMDMENRALERFRDPTGAVYQLEYHTLYTEPIFESRVFSSFDPEKMDPALASEDDVTSIWCNRIPIGGSVEEALSLCFSIKLNPDMRIMAIDPDWPREDRERKLLLDVFPGLWFDFPTPFRKGDILWDPERSDGFCGGPFVCRSINLQGVSNKKSRENIRRNGDSSDMTAHGLFVSAVDGIYGECMHSYMNCEYYPKELTGKQLLLKPFSAYEKGEIDAVLLLHACRYILLELEKENTGVKYYTEEILKKTGITL